MTVQCVSCSNWTPKQTSVGMARLGFAYCPIRSIAKGHTFSATFQRECEDFKQAEPEIVRARQKYIKRPK